ncbi:MAG: ribosome-associated translation inhibitor RaiA [Acidithiobacillus sp.]
MQITITGQHLDLTEALKMHAEDKIGKLDRHFDQVIDARAVLKHAPHENPENTADVTLYASGHVFHAEAQHVDMYRALDLVTEKLETQIDSYRQKRQDKRNDNPAGLTAIVEMD